MEITQSLSGDAKFHNIQLAKVHRVVLEHAAFPEDDYDISEFDERTSEYGSRSSKGAGLPDSGDHESGSYFIERLMRCAQRKDRPERTYRRCSRACVYPRAKLSVVELRAIAKKALSRDLRGG
jgi:hypothetical protein